MIHAYRLVYPFNQPAPPPLWEFEEPYIHHLMLNAPDFSVVLFRPDFMLASENHPMKAHKNQQLLAMPCPPDSLVKPGARGQTIVTEVQKPSQRPCMRRLLREVCSQLIDRKALSWGIIRKSACILAEITIRKSQVRLLLCWLPLSLSLQTVGCLTGLIVQQASLIGDVKQNWASLTTSATFGHSE